EWVHVQLHQQKGMISLSPPTICNSALTRLRSAAESAIDCVMKNVAAPLASLSVKPMKPTH
ncbi:hypothetical protein, partial [Klebsiella pneumoniae]|uniref:hypothetical protein n=1 Tax=Klebsiella pneumoniae TaxID=573 RepID=UPI0034644C1A